MGTQMTQMKQILADFSYNIIICGHLLYLRHLCAIG